MHIKAAVADSLIENKSLLSKHGNAAPPLRGPQGVVFPSQSTHVKDSVANLSS